jgi:hypothetical protein
MQRRSRIWIAVGILFTLGNIAGAVYAGMMGEMRHAGLHVMLAVVGAYVTRLVAARRRESTASQELAAAGVPSEFSSRLRSLERSLDAMAIEVERVGEGQRFMTRLFTERGERDREPI